MEHLPLCATMFAQRHFTLHNMPYKEVVADWRGIKTNHGCYKQNT
jgi:hypothetical protein